MDCKWKSKSKTHPFQDNSKAEVCRNLPDQLCPEDENKTKRKEKEKNREKEKKKKNITIEKRLNRKKVRNSKDIHRGGGASEAKEDTQRPRLTP